MCLSSAKKILNFPDVYDKTWQLKRKEKKWSRQNSHDLSLSYEVNLDTMRMYSSVSGREKTTHELPRRDEDILGNELDTT